MRIYQKFILSCILAWSNLCIGQGNSGMTIPPLAEYVFLHTNKTVYVTGETIWMSLYCRYLESHLPSKVSAVSAIELVNSSGVPIIQTRIAIREGRGNSQLFIDPSIPSDIFYLKAYTQWMQNEGSHIFFELPIFIVNPSIPPDWTNTPMNPLSQEGIVFADKVSHQSIQITNDQKTYNQRQQVSLDLLIPGKDADLSVSIYKIDPKLDQAYSSIKKYPQGMVSFSKKIETLPYSSRENILPEMVTPTIRGKIKNYNGSELNISFAGKYADLYAVSPDIDGNFQIEVSPNIQTEEFLLWSGDNTLQDSQIYIESPFISSKIHDPIQHFLSQKWTSLIEMYSQNVQISHLYSNQTHIRGMEPTAYSHTQFYDPPEITYYLDDYTRFPNLDDVFLEYVNKARKKRVDGKDYLHIWDEYRNIFSVSNSLAFDTAALTMIDGVPILDPDFFWKFDVFKIEQIDIIPKRYFVQNQMYAGVVHFRTYLHDFGGVELPNSIFQRPYTPLQKERRFYHPDYSDKAKTRTPDFRTTLYWNPDLQIEQQHSLSFFTGDDTGWYQIEVTGMTNEGEAVYGSSRFEVIGKDNKN